MRIYKIHLPFARLHENVRVLILLASFFILTVSTKAEVKIYSAPAGAPLTDGFNVDINGSPVPVYSGPTGYYYGFCSFDFSGTVTVNISSKFQFSNPKVLPASAGITPVVSNGKVSITITNPRQLTLLPNGANSSNALHIFANPMEVNPPKSGDAGVIYFGPGIHKPTKVTLRSNQTLYLAGGAILKAAIEINGASNVKVMGRGIIDGSDWPKWQGPQWFAMDIRNAYKVSVEGVTLRFAWGGSVAVWTSDDVTFTNFKVCNGNIINDDGLTPINTKNLLVQHCFFRTQDDCIPFKGYSSNRENLDNITVRQCTFWVEEARAILVGHETQANHMQNIKVYDCDILHYNTNHPAILVEPGEGGTIGGNVLFENIRVRSEGQNNDFIRVQPVVNQWMTIKTPGYVDGVTFRNISNHGQHNGMFISVKGYDATYTAKNVTFDNININGALVTNATDKVDIGPYAYNVAVLPSVARTYYRVKNRWNGSYLYPNNGQVIYGTPSPNSGRDLWAFRNYNGHTRIQNKATGEYLHVEHLYDYVEAGWIQPSTWSSYWIIEDVGGYKRLKNEWQGKYLHIQNLRGYVEYGILSTDYFSSQWILEAVSDTPVPTPTPTPVTPTPTPELTHSIQLQKNWNLISLPINPKDDDIADVLAPIAGQYAAVHAYNGREYESYYPDIASSSTLKKIVAGRGYWVFMKQASSLQIKGTKASKSINLIKDWNLVGYNSQTLLSAAQALASANGKVMVVYSYNTAENEYEVVNSFQPGLGYWMYASENVTWTLP
jgi:hypothetical protein